MKTILILFLLLNTAIFAQSNFSIGIGLATDEAWDPLCDESFIAGYESVGGTWGGDLDILENRGYSSLGDTTFTYDYITFNGGFSNILKFFKINSSKGTQYVLPAGSNVFRSYSYDLTIQEPVICGSGLSENVTGYGCEFWDNSPYSITDSILYIVQSGTVFPIAYIQRINSTTMRINITGNESGQYGFTHGVPIRLSDLTGTDISPLPNGTYYLSSANNNALYFSFNTTSGSLGTQVPTGGTLKYGTSDSKTFLITKNYLFIQPNWGGTIFGVNGFDNNPDTSFAFTWINVDGFGDKFEITHTLGSGSYQGGGFVDFSSQSYGTPYIAGKLAFIRDSINHRNGNDSCTAWEARYRARMTASNNGVFDLYNGYGKIDVLAAINYTGEIPTDPFAIGPPGTLTASRTDNEVFIYYDTVANATYYKLYNNDSLLLVKNVTNINYTFSTIIKRSIDKTRNKFFYIATRNDTSVISDTVTINYFAYPYLKFKR